LHGKTVFLLNLTVGKGLTETNRTELPLVLLLLFMFTLPELKFKL